MVEIAHSLDGCFGARLTGAGFGGCTVNLVAKEHIEEFTKTLARQYQMKTSLMPEVYVCRASQGAGLLNIS
jgi:galactokinase